MEEPEKKEPEKKKSAVAQSMEAYQKYFELINNQPKPPPHHELN